MAGLSQERPVNGLLICQKEVHTELLRMGRLTFVGFLQVQYRDPVVEGPHKPQQLKRGTGAVKRVSFNQQDPVSVAGLSVSLRGPFNHCQFWTPTPQGFAKFCLSVTFSKKNGEKGPQTTKFSNPLFLRKQADK